MTPSKLYLIVMFSLSCLAACSPTHRNPTGCVLNSDCDSWERCVDSECVLAGDCLTDADCQPTERCEDAVCVPGNLCQSDADCQAPTPHCDPAAGACVACVPVCADRCCGNDGCGGQCPDDCGQTGQTCDAQTCQCEGQCQPDCQGRQCGPDGCGGSCAPGCAQDETCTDQGQCVCQPACQGRQCGPWCQLGETRCSADGYGFQACGPDPANPLQNSFGPRIPCALGDACQAGACQRAGCLEAEVMIVLDRSSSMLAGGTWSWVQAGLLEQIDARQERNFFGYREFPTGGGRTGGRRSLTATRPLLSSAQPSVSRRKSA